MPKYQQKVIIKNVEVKLMKGVNNAGSCTKSQEGIHSFIEVIKREYNVCPIYLEMEDFH